MPCFDRANWNLIRERECSSVGSAEGLVSTWKPVLGNGMIGNTFPMSAYSHGTGDGLQSSVLSMCLTTRQHVCETVDFVLEFG